MYARTKRAQVILTELWAKRLAGTGVVVHAMHPGWADTPGVASSLPRFHRLTGPLLRSPEQGADTIVWLGAAAEPGESSGGFWHDRRRRPTHRVPWTRETPEDRERLWRECERLTGLARSPGPGSDPRAPIGDKPMAHYTASIETPRPPPRRSRTSATSPRRRSGTRASSRRSGSAMLRSGRGRSSVLVADFLGRKAALTYRIVEFEPGEAVTLRGENATVVSLDRITFEPSDGGTRVTYDADLALKGPLRIADPLLGLAFDRVGDRALEGLRDTLGSRDPHGCRRSRDAASTAATTTCPTTCARSTPSSSPPSDASSRRSSTNGSRGWSTWRSAARTSPSTNCRSSPPRIRRPAGSSTAAWRAASGPTPRAPGRSRSTPTSAKAVRELGLPGTDTIGVLLVDRSGRILAREHGGFDDEKTMRLAAALERSSADG